MLLFPPHSLLLFPSHLPYNHANRQVVIGIKKKIFILILIFSQFFHSQSPSLGGERRNDKPGGMNRKLIPFYPPSLYATSADGQSGGMRSSFLVPSNWVLRLEASVTKAKTPITEHLKFSQQTFKQNHWGILSNTQRASSFTYE